MTLRQAVAELVKQGVLVRKRGNGTFVDRGYLDITDRQNGPLTGGVGAEPDKSRLRREVWSKLREVARPDSRFHWNFEEFVPDFEGSDHCARAIRDMAWYQQSNLIFMAPDNSLTRARQYAIEDQKQLIVATYAIARGFRLVERTAIPPGHEQFAATLDGIEQFGRSISLDEIKALGTIELLVTGISLVTRKGVRWGKGHGYFDLEWALFREIGAVDENTPVIAVGHDCQVVSDELEPSAVDTIVDMIVTPTRVVKVERTYPKPKGILWEYISAELRQQISPLQTLYSRRQQDAET